MAKITRLASTLIARYYPSKTYTDAFYMDGRLFGKREVRNADITMDKEEKGFFFSVFSHPTIAGYEPGMIPPYEPQLRGICNEVKFGRKPIDAMISGFLTTAVDITGKMKLQDQDSRAPYFAGIIVHDSEAFAVTIGSGLAFLYRNDTLYPLTDAGIPMENLDAFGNRVGDFYNFVSSKTANALWSNITTLSVDDCIILCNKAVYDALGQRELLRILDEADDQCDAAGTVMTQAAANMPNVPMQFSISFVESITADEKKGLFGFRKKNKEEDTSNMSIESTVEGGTIGAAAEAIAGAGFVSGITATTEATATASEAVAFGDGAEEMPKNAVIPDLDEVSFSKFVVPEEPEISVNEEKVEFLDSSVAVPDVEEIPAEKIMKSLVGEMNASKQEGLNIQKAAEEEAKKSLEVKQPEENVPETGAKIEDGATLTPQSADIPSDSPFVAAFNPFTSAPAEVKESEMETVSETPVELDTDDSMMDTKTVSSFDSLFANQVQKDSGIASDGIIAAALKELKEESDAEAAVEEAKEITEVKEEVKEETKPEVKPEPSMPVTVNDDEIVFSSGEKVESFEEEKKEEKPFDPYSVGNTDDIANAKPVVFPTSGFGGFELDEKDTSESGGDSVMTENERPVNEPSFDWKEEGVPTEPLADEVPVPEFDMNPEKTTVNPVENVSFPLSEQEAPAPAVPDEVEPAPVTGSDFVIPFENAVIAEPEATTNVQNDVPDMPVYGSQSFDVPTYAVNSEQEATDTAAPAYEVGSYEDNEDMAPEQAPYQSYGSESFEPEEADDSAYEQPYEITDDVQEYAQQEYAAQPGYDQQYDQPYEQPQQYEEAPQYETPDAFSDPNIGAQESYENGAYTEPAGYDYSAAAATTAAADATEAAAGDEWINSILGLDDNGVDTAATPYNSQPSPAPQRPGGSPRPRPQQKGPNPNGGAPRRPSGQGRPATQGSGNRGGGGNNNRPFRLSRNGAIFLVFVGVLFIALIVIISLIVKSCSSKDKKPEETKTTETTVESVVEITTPTESVDANAPIGVFVFSSHTGYRTWWDLFKQSYNIEIEGDTDARVAIVRQFNGAAADYMPSEGDRLLLPPLAMINGSVPVPGAEATGETTADGANGEVEGTPSVSEGGADTAST